MYAMWQAHNMQFEREYGSTDQTPAAVPAPRNGQSCGTTCTAVVPRVHGSRGLGVGATC